MTSDTVIAVVDDDRAFRIALRRLLMSAGFEAEAFGSAREFLDRSERHRHRCVILDLRMPECDGLELQARLLELDPAPAIVFVTAHHDQDEERRARSHGAVAFLSKPVESEALLAAVRRALRLDP